MSKFEFVERLKASYPVTRRCRVLGVSPSGYWGWRKRGSSARTKANAALQPRIVGIHAASRATDGAASRATDGAPRIHAELRAQGERCSRKRVARLMRLAGVAGRHHRRFRTTRSRASERAGPRPASVCSRGAQPSLGGG